jgi:hypothetical protein
MEAQRLRSRLAFWYSRVIVVVAAAFLAQIYTIEIPPYLDLRKYALGQERMPFQRRELMRYPLLWAGNSSFLQHHTAGHAGINSPERLVMLIVSFVSILLSIWVAQKIDRHFWPKARAPLLPFAVLVVVFLFDFCLSVPYSFPYDLPAMMFLGWGLYLVLTQRFWWLLPLFAVATWNRETSLFLIYTLAAVALTREGKWRLQSIRQREGAQLVTLSVVWCLIVGYLQHRYAGHPSEASSRVAGNLLKLARPVLWPAILSGSAFLLPWIFWRRDLISARPLRACIMVLPLWVLILFYAGQILEVRIYGDISVFVAVCAVAILRAEIGGEQIRENEWMEETSAAA